MPETTTAEPVLGATEVVEAATAEAAIAELHDRLGADARILEARRVLRGGVGGFFAREVVQLHAAPGGSADRRSPAPAAGPSAVPPAPDPATAVPAPAPEPPTTATPSVAGSPVDRLIAGADEVPDAVDFATFLRRQLAERQASTAPPEAASPAGEATRPMVVTAPPPPDPAPPTSGGPATPGAPRTTEAVTEAPATAGPGWSATALIRLGVPGELARSLELDEGADDVTWTTAVAGAVRTICRPLPTGPSVLVGPRAPELGDAVGIPVARSDRFLAAMRSERWLHLVVGGDGWRDLLADDPLAVSWADSADLPDAIRCAVDLGLVLGFGPFDGGVRRATPVDVATALRRLVAGLGRADRRERSSP